jgi:O-antigen/teichoic acid export membrane protein
VALKPSSIGGRALWTIAAYGASAVLRFASSVILARLLAPEILGVVVIAQAIRVGTELLTDMGMEQNVVHSPDGDDERFLNTLWTLQLLRGAIIAVATLCAAYAVSRFYEVQAAVLVAMAAAPFLNSLASTSLFSLSRHLQTPARNLFELAIEGASLALNVALALWLRNVWAPILGIIATLAVRSAASYLLPHPRHRLLLDAAHGRAIFGFGKWVMLSSLMLFGAVYADRLLLGHVAGLAVLGIYGLARAICDVPSALASRLAMQVVFPVVARDLPGTDAAIAAELARTRRNILLLFLAGIATVMAWSDRVVRLLYDDRYQQAGWMLFVLLFSAWASVLAWLGEATLFGHGRTRTVSLANTVRLAVMALVLPAGYAAIGLPGAVLALPAAELARYFALRLGQRRLANGFLLQDLELTLGFIALLAVWLALRVTLGLGVPWAGMS